MGKSEPQLPLHEHRQNHEGSSILVRCSMGFSPIARSFSFKCVFVLLLGVSVLLTAVFSAVRFRHGLSGFDARSSIKRSATVQAYFRLQKPVSFLLPRIARIEYDINAEIGVPFTQVAILSVHKAVASNLTKVVFGVLSEPSETPMNPVSLSVLRSSLVDLFTRRSNLTLTASVFGQPPPSSFEILKFPGGITVAPKQSAFVWMLPRVFFNFTLPNNSIREIQGNFAELKRQLESGLHLKSYESVYVRVTNKAGSTRDPPVTVQASIVSNLGNLLPQRLKQLAQVITGSLPARNLGLDHSVFGRVKEISLSSYLYDTLDAPTPSPAPSPEKNHHPSLPATPPSAASPHYLPPCSNCVVSSPTPDVWAEPPRADSPAPPVDPPCGGLYISPAPSPLSSWRPGFPLA